MLRIFPTLALAALAFNYFIFFDPTFLSVHFFKLVLPSGMPLALTGGELLVAGSLLLLFVEMVKSAGCSKVTAIDHALSLLVFAVCLVEFVTVPRAGNVSFLLITLMTLVDVAAGFAISLSAARRDMSLTTG